jgi:hypothetical protein
LALEVAVLELTIAPVIERLASRLSTTDTDLLHDLVVTMSFPNRTAALGAFPLWRDTEPFSLPPP